MLLDGNFLFGERAKLPFGDITVIPNLDIITNIDQLFGRRVRVKYNSVESVATRYQNISTANNLVKNSNVVHLSIESDVPEKAEDYLNELVYQYNLDAINDRNQIAQKTSNFIDSRLEIITRELDSVEGNKEDFKTKNRLVDIVSEAQLTLSNASEFQKRQFDVGTQIELAETMLEYINTSSGDELLPSNIGLQGENIGQSVANYNQLLLERNRLLKNSTAQNPVVANVNNQIEQLRSSIVSSLENNTNNLKITMRDLNLQASRINSKIAAVPKNEKLYRGIERQQSIKEQLYLFLLQQREQASISLAVTAPKAKVVDPAYTSTVPVKPQKLIIYAGALIAGLIIPFLFIYVSSLLSFKIKNRKDVERVLNKTTILGEIPKLTRGQDELIQPNDRSVLAESFRILRTNLQYLFINSETEKQIAKRIFVSSTIKGEGKTFVAFNLALTLASTGKKVILIGADIRNPQLHRYLENSKKSEKGVTEFIVDDSLKAKDLVKPSAFDKNLDIMLSGTIPPNPAELLLQPRTKEIFTQLEGDYDYIIVDTAPAMLVTDTILINKLSDVMLYVVRADYTDKRLLEFPKDAIADKRLHNVSIVLNNVSMSNFGYGNKYGYAYSEDKPSRWKRMFGR